MSTAAPLNVLLSHALLDLTRSGEREGAAEVVLWADLLRALDDGGIAEKELPTRLRLSKRAVKSMVNCADRVGWARRDGGTVRVTDEGRSTRDEWGCCGSRVTGSQRWNDTARSSSRPDRWS